MPYPTKVVAMYHMMWSNSGSKPLSQTPANVNVVNMSFAQGDPLSLVGWASDGEAAFVAAAKNLRSRGVRMVISVGGAGGAVNVSNRQSFVNSVMAINAKVPLDGLDWDLEGPSLVSADVVWIAQELDRLRGANFAQTMAPNGSNVGQYLPVARALQSAGLLDAYGQQFYDSDVSKEAALGRVNEAIANGIPENKITIGMMNPPGSVPNGYWSVDTCIANMNWLKLQRPGLRGGYLWEAGRAGAADWATRVGPILLR